MAIQTLSPAFSRFFDGSTTVSWVFDTLDLECHGVRVVTDDGLAVPLQLIIDGLPGGQRNIAIPPNRNEFVPFPQIPERFLMHVWESDADVKIPEDITAAALADPVFLADIVAGLVPHTGIGGPDELTVQVRARIPRAN